MRLSEIAEQLVVKYSDSCMACNDIVKRGCREEWYEEILINELMDFFSYEIINICGCGVPENTYEVIRKILHTRQDFSTNKITYEDVENRYKDELQIDTKNEYHYGILQFVLYV